MKRLIRDEDCQVFSIDVMLGLIIIVVIMGISADSMDLISYKIQEFSYSSSMERIVEDAADVLIETPGTPENWEECDPNVEISPGLAQYDNVTGKTVPNTLSIKKISKLQNHYEELIYGKILPDIMHSTMIIIPLDSKFKPLIIHEDEIDEQSPDTFIINRTILTNYIDSKVVINIGNNINSANTGAKNLNYEKCPHNDLNGTYKHENPKKGQNPFWICKHFTLSKKELDSSDFYVFTEPLGNINTVEWIIDRNEKISNKGNRFDSKPRCVTDRIQEVLGQDENATLWLHVKISSNQNPFMIYLVSLPKGNPMEMVSIEYLNPIPCNFILKAWI